MCNSAAHELARCRLLDLGAHIATPTSEKTAEKVKRMKVEDVWVDDLELWIDEMDKYSSYLLCLHLLPLLPLSSCLVSLRELPPLKNFILPSGGLASATLHNARTVCRLRRGSRGGKGSGGGVARERSRVC
mmetsp:Transcript_40296/g.126849  ORF Transcript_40296/g.126849 Transcript_40296/m.126849 type:complete len:131 (+) Transcript_40296:577-969(+)